MLVMDWFPDVQQTILIKLSPRIMIKFYFHFLCITTPANTNHHVCQLFHVGFLQLLSFTKIFRWKPFTSKLVNLVSILPERRQNQLIIMTFVRTFIVYLVIMSCSATMLCHLSELRQFYYYFCFCIYKYGLPYQDSKWTELLADIEYSSKGMALLYSSEQ